ncbi:MAG TPA: hypothetical protein VK188_05795 [Holophaga sp.]|nr:hypothetical protein [Holophaga sp.]
MAELSVDAGAGGLGRLRDAILMKVALEGKSFQAARREAAEEAAARGEAPAAEEDLEVSTLEASAVRVEVATADFTLSIEAVRVEASSLSVRRKAEAPPKDPLVVDLEGGGPRTTGAGGARAFDLGGDGRVAPTSFVTGGSAFLALDRNGNGSIDDGRELFGDQHGAADGFAELARFDDNADGVIDGRDAVYGRLELLYGSGARTSLASGGVVSIGLDAPASGAVTASGDTVLRAGRAALGGGGSAGIYAMGLRTFDALA